MVYQTVRFYTITIQYSVTLEIKMSKLFDNLQYLMSNVHHYRPLVTSITMAQQQTLLSIFDVVHSVFLFNLGVVAIKSFTLYYGRFYSYGALYIILNHIAIAGIVSIDYKNNILFLTNNNLSYKAYYVRCTIIIVKTKVCLL